MFPKTKTMNLLDFYNKFPNETYCRKYLKEKREDEGFTCKKCGGMELMGLLIIYHLILHPKHL
jgi:hypothetical protein